MLLLEVALRRNIWLRLNHGRSEKRRCGDSKVGDGTGSGSIHRDEAGHDVTIAGMLGCERWVSGLEDDPVEPIFVWAQQYPERWAHFGQPK